MSGRDTAAADGPTASDSPAQRQGAELESQGAEFAAIFAAELERLKALEQITLRLRSDAQGEEEGRLDPKSTAVEMPAAALVGPSDSREPAAAS